MLITEQHLGRLFQLDYRMDLHGLAVGMVGTLKAFRPQQAGRTGQLVFLQFPIGPQKLVTAWVASTSCTLLGPAPVRTWPRLVLGQPWVDGKPLGPPNELWPCEGAKSC